MGILADGIENVGGADSLMMFGWMMLGWVVSQMEMGLFPVNVELEESGTLGVAESVKCEAMFAGVVGI